MDEMESKKRKLELLAQQCLIIYDYFIENDRRRGKDSSFEEQCKQNFIKRYEEKKDNIKLLSRNISGYRMALNDLKEMARDSLKKEELAELKQRIVNQLGPDAV